MKELFDEDTFVRALMERPEDAKRFATNFSPEWVRKAELAPILDEIFGFVKKYGVGPSLPTLHKVFKDRDEGVYNLRYQEVLNRLEKVENDHSHMLYTLDRAKDYAIIRSFQQFASDSRFLELQADMKGVPMLEALNRWQLQFGSENVDRTMNIKEATDHLVQNHGFASAVVPIPCGIQPIDEWCGGGLRQRNLGIVLAGTGHGKSVTLMNQALKIASAEEKKVWYVTNELMLEEQVERFLSRMTGLPVSEVIEDPGMVYSEALGRHWQRGLDKRLWITEVNREVSTDDLEAEMSRLATLTGWKPEVIIIDYMERMRPNMSGFQRDKTWSWLGAIAQDLTRLAKRHNVLIWTASQTNRAGLSANELRLEHAQGSVKHLQEAALVVSMIQTKHPDPTKTDTVVMEFSVLKARHSRKLASKVCLEARLDKMVITNDVVTMPTFETDDDDEIAIEKPKRKRRRFGENGY